MSAHGLFFLVGFTAFGYRSVGLVAEQLSGLVLVWGCSAVAAVRMLSHIAWLRDKLDAVEPDVLRAGVLLHTGQQALKVGDRRCMAAQHRG